ncbi:MAG TPA: ATP-binding cassette domain-containing protein [Chitinophagaceae bacterium]
MIRNLKKAFGSNTVLDGFNLLLRQGENLVVLGRSGSGKSVLIKCVIGLLPLDDGEITVLGENVSEMNTEELDRIRVKMGFLFQSNALYDSMTVRENLEFALRRHRSRLSQEAIKSMVMEALEDVALAHTVDMMPAELSGGMRKRVALARTLILKPKIILYDEPTTGLDPITGKEISELILEVQKKYNASALIISHDMRCVKLTADRIVVLINGKCYAEGTFEELKNSKDPEIYHFFE